MSAMTQILAFSGQSNYDLSLEVYGDLNNFINFLSLNGLSNTTDLKKNYLFDNNVNKNSNNIINDKIDTGVTYATLSKKVNPVLNPLLNNDGEILLNNDGESLFNNF